MSTSAVSPALAASVVSPIHYVPFHDARKWRREGLRTRDGHVARQLVRALGPEAITVIDRPTGFAEFAKLRGDWLGGPIEQRYGSTVRVTSPTGAPAVDTRRWALGLRGGSFHRWVMDAYGEPALARAVRTADPRDPSALWLCHPFAADLRTYYGSVPVVVDAFDNFAIHAELPVAIRGACYDRYRELCADAAGIAVNSVATQEYLWREFRRETLVVPNGVDPTLFTGATPLDLPGVSGRVLAYAGKLGLRVDVDLLVQLAEALPPNAGTIVIAGQNLNAAWMTPALTHPRIRWIGDLHYTDLPRFLARADLCLVPHRVGAGEVHGDATKLYEYLAAGKPIVTTAIGGTDRFRSRVAVADSSAAFVEAVLAWTRGEALPQGTLGADETWAARTATLCRHFGIPFPDHR